MRNLSPAVVAFARERNLTPNEVRTMVRQAAPCTSDYGNRRYHDFVFQIEGNDIVSMYDIKDGLFVTKREQRATLQDDEFIQYEDCEDCLGPTCKKCNGLGEIRYIRKLKSNKLGVMR